jgi:hypothetical protein
MRRAEGFQEEGVRQAIRNAADDTIFAGVTLPDSVRIRIHGRAHRGSLQFRWFGAAGWMHDRRQRALVWRSGAIVAAAAILLVVLFPGKPTLPGVSPPTPGVVAPVVRGEDHTDRQVVPQPSITPAPPATTAPNPPSQLHSGPAVMPFGLNVEPLTEPVKARSWPELLTDSPVIEAGGGTQLPVKITWQTQLNDAFRADLSGTHWLLVPTSGARSQQPLLAAEELSSPAFSQQAPLVLAATLGVPTTPGWYQVFLEAKAVRQSDQAGLAAGANAFRLFVPYPAGSVRTGEITPGPEAAGTRDGITLQVDHVQMTEQFTFLTYHLTLPTAVHAPAGHNLRLAWDDGTWIQPVIVGEREGAPDADGHVRSISGQAFFPSVDRQAIHMTLQIPSLDVVVPTGGPYGSVQTMPGPWTVQIRVPNER